MSRGLLWEMRRIVEIKHKATHQCDPGDTHTHRKCKTRSDLLLGSERWIHEASVTITIATFLVQLSDGCDPSLTGASHLPRSRVQCLRTAAVFVFVFG